MEKRRMEKNQFWSSTRIGTRTSFISHLHNDLPDCITSICKTFADNTSLFSKVQDINKSVNELNWDLGKVGD